MVVVLFAFALVSFEMVVASFDLVVVIFEKNEACFGFRGVLFAGVFNKLCHLE